MERGKDEDEVKKTEGVGQERDRERDFVRPMYNCYEIW